MSKSELQKVNDFLLDHTFETTHKGKQVRVIPVTDVWKVLNRLQTIKQLTLEVQNLEKLNRLNNMLDEALRKKPVQAKTRIQPPGT